MTRGGLKQPYAVGASRFFYQRVNKPCEGRRRCKTMRCKEGDS